jgi:Raf kinase inhibitor-like YbhB/YbcL family protein
VRLAVFVLAAAAIGPACARDPAEAGGTSSPSSPGIANLPPLSDTMKIQSPAFAANGEIPSKYTCEGEDISPPLGWGALPDGAKSLVLVVDDPDAPDPAKPQRTWVHWVLYDMPPTTTTLAEGVKELAEGMRQGKNDWKKTGWGGPCPPIGRHRYFFKLYVLDATLGDLHEPTKAELEKVMAGHVIARAELVGTYQKRGK